MNVKKTTKIKRFTIEKRADRRYPDHLAREPMDPFQRDLYRVRNSQALWRLMGVTQVVGPQENQLFHNRYTHSMKVGQLARQIAERILATSEHALIQEAGGLDPNVAEVAGLAHDMGHPPFAHIAEYELDRALCQQNDLDGYDGNAQAFRLVNKLIIWNDSFRGLNLTRASLRAILKYPWMRETAGRKSKKFGAYHCEAPDFEFATAESNGDRSLEAEIMDLADDITYAVHDLFDFYRAGLIPLPLLAASADERKRFLTDVVDSNSDSFGPVTNKDIKNSFEAMLYYLQPEREYLGLRSQDVRIRFGETLLINRYVELVELKKSSRTRRLELSIPPIARAEIELLKLLNRYYVIEGRTLSTQQNAKSRIIRFLFDVNLEALNSKNWRSVLPISRREQLADILAAAELNEEKPQVSTGRIVADYISSLTDSEAILLFRRLQGIDLGRVTDWLPGY